MSTPFTGVGDRGTLLAPECCIADELGISDQAVNERMRRGMAKLVVSSLTAGADAE
jgi:FixJ family two-component response regulator